MEEVKNVEVPASDLEKIYAFLSYCMFFGFLIYKAKKDSDFVQHHAKQGMVLFSISFIANLVLLIIPVLGWALMFFVTIASVIYFIIGANNALVGNLEKLPFIGHFSNAIK
jgi:uncharacterized membrane protein